MFAHSDWPLVAFYSVASGPVRRPPREADLAPTSAIINTPISRTHRAPISPVVPRIDPNLPALFFSSRFFRCVVSRGFRDARDIFLPVTLARVQITSSLLQTTVKE